MPEYFRENGGAVLSTTFDKYCYVEVRHLPPFFEYRNELIYSRSERVKTVDEIREAAYRIADVYHTAFIMPKDSEKNPMLALGLNYVRFGSEEKNLFRFLFQTDKFGGTDVKTLMGDPNLSGILEIMADGLACTADEAREMFLTFFCAAHGLASLLANNSMGYDEEQCAKMLEQVFYGTIAARKGKQNAEAV